MKPLLPEQREALIDALVENWQNLYAANLDDIRDILDDMLINGRVGYADMTDEALVQAAIDLDTEELDDRLAELGISGS